jgi:hypothetical protein
MVVLIWAWNCKVDRFCERTYWGFVNQVRYDKRFKAG